MAAGLVTPPDVAVMMTVPGETAVTSPVLLMVATPEKLLDQLKMAPLMAFPFESVAEAMNCLVSPTLMLAVMGEMETEATTGVTVRVTGELVTPDPEAVI